MCGIVGVFSEESRPVSADVLAMSETLTHRGPDDSGTYSSGPIALGHRRLSIIDVDGGHQPIFNEDNSICVIFNGEIYNYRSLRSSLSDSKHSFRTETDTEVLVHLYEEYGPSFVQHLEGMFAFALWDEEKEQLVLARDSIGIKPLLIANDDKRIAFASELPAILASGIDHGGIHAESIAQYFGLGYIPYPRTAFNNIQKLQPGTLAIISQSRVEYENFCPPSIKSRDVSFSDAVSGLRTRLEQAVENRLMSDVPLGAFLSGGIDSSIVVGIMTEISDQPVNTYTIGFNESLFDESWAAQEVAEYHNTDHTKYTVTPEEVRSAIPSVLNQFGEPFGDPSVLPTFVVSRETSQDVKVALSGDGADELFAGYSRYRGEYFSKYYRQLPALMRTHVIEPAINSLNVSRGSEQGELVRKVQKFVRGGTPDAADRHFEWARIPDDNAVSAFEAIKPADSARRFLGQEHEKAASYLPEGRQDDLSKIMAVDTYSGLPNQILHKTDLASMNNSLEVRVPFLDKNVVEYAMSLPLNYKITPRKQKRVLKRAFDDVLPNSILQRQKQGFDMPIGEWFKNELASEFRDTVTGVNTDLINHREVMRLFENHKRGESEHGKFIWSVYVFAHWYRRLEADGII